MGELRLEIIKSTLLRHNYRLTHSEQRKIPRQFPAGGSVRSRDQILEVALSAEQHGDAVLVLQLKRKNPRQFPAGGSVRSRDQILEVALSAEQHGDAVLVLQLIHSEWLHKRGSRLEDDSTRVLLVQLHPVDVGREG